MKISDYRKMRAIILFDLPSVEKQDIANNQKFIKKLKKIGFYMLQFSVYTKVLINQSEYDRIIKKVKQIIPNKGNIIILKLTDKQYNDMIYLNGEKNKYDSIVGLNNVVYFGGDDYN
jgi:CRISPR-associated endoribonuclease cas2